MPREAVRRLMQLSGEEESVIQTCSFSSYSALAVRLIPFVQCSFDPVEIQAGFANINTAHKAKTKTLPCLMGYLVHKFLICSALTREHSSKKHGSSSNFFSKFCNCKTTVSQSVHLCTRTAEGSFKEKQFFSLLKKK